MVRNDDSIGTVFDSFLCIFWGHNPLEDNRTSPEFLNLSYILPAKAWVKLFFSPRRERRKVGYILGMAGDVAECPATVTKYIAQSPRNFCRKI